MRYGPEQKGKTRGKILEAAARLFRRDGYQASGVDRVMGEAGLTPGGFYAHFRSKQALLAEALAHAEVEMGARLGARIGTASGSDWIEAFLDDYLSDSHREQPEHGCPLVALLSEVSRAEGPVKATFEGMVLRLVNQLQAQAKGSDSEGSRQRALAAMALCVGGLGLSRSVLDPALASEILEACRVQASSILECGRRPKPRN